MQYMQRSKHFISGFSLYQWETLHNHLVFRKLELEFSVTPNKRRVIEQSINFKNSNDSSVVQLDNQSLLCIGCSM